MDIPQKRFIENITEIEIIYNHSMWHQRDSGIETMRWKKKEYIVEKLSHQGGRKI